MERISLGLALHNHQPVGNFPWVFEQAYEMAYLPMLDALERHPFVRLSLHYSGPLLDWLNENQPAFLTRISALVKRGQVEIISGAYYEPILPAIPDADKVGQVRKMHSFIAQKFGSKPSGLWLAERVWEPSLPKPLFEAGVDWTLVDDTHFKMVGFKEEALTGYYLTEEQGYSVKVFPSSKKLRYLIPWKDPQATMDYLRSLATEDGGAILVMGDDGEKFGVWPETYKHCWQDGWVERFLHAIEEGQRQEWLSTIPLGEYASRFPPRGRSYLPCASYEEMLEWALPADKGAEFTAIKHELEAQKREDVLQFLRGGYWRNFLVKYPEVNLMHKKMMRVHGKVYRMTGAPKELSEAKDELWQGQCNCPYWHGVFGGIYLTDIRYTNYHHLIRAEKLADDAVHKGKPWLDIEETDFDYDGRKELLVDGDSQSLYFKPEEGGSLFEWDLRKPAHNLLSTLARRPEAYHRQLLEASKQTEQGGGVKSIHDVIRVKDQNLPAAFPYDGYLRVGLLDHFLSPKVTLEQFAGGIYEERGDFINRPYEVKVNKAGLRASIQFRRQCHVRSNGQALPFEVVKRVEVAGNGEGMKVEYVLTNRSEVEIRGLFGGEWNINLLGGGHNPMAYYEIPALHSTLPLDSKGELNELAEIRLGNRQLGIELRLTIEPAVRLWYLPVESISSSEGGVETVYQASCLLLLLPLQLAPGEEKRLRLEWEAPVLE